jgi:PEP-CTERM motif
MKNLASAAALILGAIVASQSAQAQVTPNDLYMGFQNQAGGGSADYIINLGLASSLTGSSSVVDLSSDFSLGDFTSAGLQGTNSTSIAGGVVGGSNGNTPSDIYLTELRSGGSGIPSAAGSSAPTGLTRAQDNSAYSVLAQITAPGAGTGLLDTSRSWESSIEPTLTTSSFYGVTGDNPDSQVGTVLYEDLWGTSNSSGLGGPQSFVYEGYFTLDLTGSSPDLTFTSALVPVPEPSAYLMSGLGGFLLLLLRGRRSWRRSA